MLRDDQSPLWHLLKVSPGVREQDLRNYLGSFNFPGDMATDAIEHFSGGEKARLALALIVWQRPNLLLLDEPTNHLDLETREALTVALAQFEGTLILVSHDRHLLRATTDRFLIVADGGLRPSRRPRRLPRLAVQDQARARRAVRAASGGEEARPRPGRRSARAETQGSRGAPAAIGGAKAPRVAPEARR